MTIILTTRPNLSDDKTLNILGDFGDAVGIPGFPQPNRDRGAKNSFDAIQSDINNVINKLTGRSNQEQFDPSYVGDGRQRIPGGTVQGGKAPPLEEANVRQVYSQTPHISIIIKKKAFSGLSHLYDTTFMDSAEQWLFRSIKRMVASKCETMALYERLTKAQKLDELGASPGLILASLVSTKAEEFRQVDYFTSAMQLQRSMADRQVPEVTTYHVDASLPLVEKLGPGIGVFEITSVSGVNTNLSLEGSGSASFNVEDPYRILIVTEHDIETAIRESALSRFVDAVSTAAGLSLSSAQSSDSILQKTREDNGKSAITFSVGVGSNSGVTAVIDAIGFEINEDNLNDVPEPHTLTNNEESLFKNVLKNLKNYEFSMRKNLLSGLGNLNSQKLKEQVKYVREKMRLYHMGKSIIQPTDSVHIYIDGGTRKLGETGNIEDPNENFNLKTLTGSLNVTGHLLGLQNDNQIDDDLLRIEWIKEGQHMNFKDFKILRTMQSSGEGGMHVFGGIVKTVTDKYDAGSGKFTLSVNCGPNIEWLKLSRFNQSPSLKQIQGIVYDPLTPFNFEIDKATGLPIGKPEWLDENKEILNGRNKPKIYFNNGEKVGTRVQTESDAALDIRQVGGNILTLYQHAPGLVYRWKPGIMTATYNMATIDPKDGTAVNYDQLRREVGFYSSNTPFDNMDAANIISLLVTGRPYDPVRFVQSALQTGAFSVDSTYNDYRHYFHTFLDVQQSVNFVQGNFTPFKTYNISPKTFADGISLQRRLTDKSSRLTQLRTQLANLEDKYYAIKDDSNPIKRGLNSKITSLKDQITSLLTEIKGDSDNATNLKGSALYIAGNDITFDLLGGDNNVKLFGDRLRHASLRRREDVIRGKDNNYLIISDEYDKDYDIQAFVLKLKEQAPELWKSDWKEMLGICQEVAKTLNFEFFTDSQGHIVFRPPQYNRTPASVFNNLFSMEQYSGLGILPDFLRKLFLSREQAILKEITILEWELILKAAVLGKESESEAMELLDNDDVFVYNNFNSLKEIAERNFAQTPKERKSLQSKVQSANKSIQLGSGLKGGAFTAKSQVNLQKELLEFREFLGSDTVGAPKSENLYNKARSRLTQLRGTKLSSIPEYNKAKVGVSRNGQSRPASDIANTISDVSNIISRRSKLLLLLEKVINQNIEVANMDSTGQIKFSPEGLINSNYKNISSIYEQLIEDDSKNILGHMSGERFVIKDEHIISASFEENPADMTTVQVRGTEPIVGGTGSLADVPVYTSFGVDFDLWRQYGWRGERAFDKPYFWSAELQCAPYAVMLLSRQRRNIVQGTVTLMGNEYYQLGDVVYITHRNMLYYVDSVQHQFTYNNNFTTTLHLKYGHPPGEYIPTPLDVIGKGVVTRGQSHSAYRVRRETPVEETTLGVIVFQKDSNHLLKGPNGRRNFEELKRVSLIANQYLGKKDDSVNSPRVYIMSFAGDENRQDTRGQSIRSWFNSPYSPGESSGGIGTDGLGDVSNTTNLSTEDKEIMNYQINDAFLQVQHINQVQDYENLSPSEKELIRSGLVADQKTISIDRTLENVIEIRLRQPPVGGWKRNNS